MKHSYIVSYPTWNAKKGWRKKEKAFTDIVEANDFIKAVNEGSEEFFHMMGYTAHIKHFVLTASCDE